MVFTSCEVCAPWMGSPRPLKKRSGVHRATTLTPTRIAPCVYMAYSGNLDEDAMVKCWASRARTPLRGRVMRRDYAAHEAGVDLSTVSGAGKQTGRYSFHLSRICNSATRLIRPSRIDGQACCIRARRLWGIRSSQEQYEPACQTQPWGIPHTPLGDPAGTIGAAAGPPRAA